jgi:hypothetical protein
VETHLFPSSLAFYRRGFIVAVAVISGAFRARTTNLEISRELAGEEGAGYEKPATYNSPAIGRTPVTFH